MTHAASKSDILKANDAFYDAVRTSDFMRLDRLWSRKRPVAVYHLGWVGLDGREDVMASWVEIFLSGQPLDIWPVEELIIMTTGTALVHCGEITGEERRSATNVFVREGANWRMTQHMSYA